MAVLSCAYCGTRVLERRSRDLFRELSCALNSRSWGVGCWGWVSDRGVPPRVRAWEFSAIARARSVLFSVVRSKPDSLARPKSSSPPPWP